MRSKRYQKIKSKLDKNRVYTLDEALDFISMHARAKFDESIETNFILGIDPKKSEQQVRGSTTLPHDIGKKKKIAAFVSPEKTKEAKDAGADVVGGQDLIEKIKKTKKCDFDIAIAEPTIMKDLAHIAKILGPRGLMPSPKTETITTDIKGTINELSKGKLFFKNDAGGGIHVVIGKVSWKEDKIKDNFNTIVEAVKKAKPPKIKDKFIKNIVLASTMGPGFKISL
ncbi:50S ribosomal protein L1 [Patescibacteria group bacterium AH-259-L05]|nr:50S ribosomal protein L1 [Patescibacteria group bacterium AH-259-L05]